MSDARALICVRLATGEEVTLCGTHELMYRRTGSRAASIAELRASFGERRSTDRRGRGELDELAAMLNDAFMPNRRAGERRERRVVG